MTDRPTLAPLSAWLVGLRLAHLVVGGLDLGGAELVEPDSAQVRDEVVLDVDAVRAAVLAFRPALPSIHASAY